MASRSETATLGSRSPVPARPDRLPWTSSDWRRLFLITLITDRPAAPTHLPVSGGRFG